MLKKFQLDPIEMERLLQQRQDPSKDLLKVELPRDASLKEAVARMTEAAKAENRLNLIMTQSPVEEARAYSYEIKSDQRLQ